MAELNTARIERKLRFKKNLLLHEIRREGQISRLQLARRLRLSNSRVCDLVQEMLDAGLLVERSPGAERRGRNPVPVRVNPAHGRLLGFDMEARRARLIVVDFAGATVWERQERLDPALGRERLIDRLAAFFAEALPELRRRFDPLIGAGLAGPGVVDVATGRIVHYDLLAGARDIPLRDLVREWTGGLPCVLDENIRALTRAEWLSGAGRGLDSFICLAVRSGVAAGIVINGRIHSGSHGLAGKAGYFPIPAGRRVGHWRTLMSIASQQALGVEAETAAQAPPAAARRAGEILGSQMATMATLLDPEAFVLAGPLILPGGPMHAAMTETFRRFVLPDIAPRIELRPAQLGPFAAALGAAHRSFETLFPTEGE